MSTTNEATAFPLQWPAGYARTRSQERSRFGARSFAGARDNLLNEVRLLGGNAITLSTNVQLRADGLPRSGDREPRDRGVALYFRFKGRPMALACDRWISVTDNLWAVAKTIEAMRGIERWGVSEMLERSFTGFAQIAPPSPATKPWWTVLGVPQTATKDQARIQYRMLATQHHPDRGGSTAKMAELNAARDASEAR